MFKVVAKRHLSAFALARFGGTRFARTTCSTRELLALLLRCFGYVEICGYTQALANPSARKLILDGLCPTSPRGLRRSASSRLVCACTHYLVFKEPTRKSPLSQLVPERPFVREPSDVTSARLSCQPFSSGLPMFPSSAPKPNSFWGTLQDYQPRFPLSTSFCSSVKLSWLPVGLAERRDGNCSGPAGANVHRRYGGSRLRQNDNIRRGTRPVNPQGDTRNLAIVRSRNRPI
jgi:hypothetical protein